MTTQRHTIILAAALALPLALAACQSVPITSIPALTRLDPLALSGETLRATVTHQHALNLSTGNTLTLRLSQRDGPQILAKSFPLRRTMAVKDQTRTITKFQIAAEDRATFNATMADLRARRKRKDQRYSFAITVDLKPCLSPGAPAAAEQVDIDLATSADSAELALARGLNLRQSGIPLADCPAPTG